MIQRSERVGTMRGRLRKAGLLG
ncbi:MAG: hypothetical protein JWO62_3346, partial [Acidimicrobiaceae bacterium]|nr:hypothetical protein [Acidimicrobiaceae bacterium]